MSEQEKAIKKLNGLLEKNYDARDGYVKAMEDVKDPALRNYFQQRAEKRSQFSNELTREIVACGGEPKDKGSSTGSLHRTWMDIKSSMSGNKEESMLKECIRGDKASVDEYQDAMNDKHLDPKAKELIQREKSQVEQTLGRIRTMEDVRKHYS